MEEIFMSIYNISCHLEVLSIFKKRIKTFKQQIQGYLLHSLLSWIIGVM